MATEGWETWYSFRPVGAKELPYRATLNASQAEAAQAIENCRNDIWEEERLTLPPMEIVVMYRKSSHTDWEAV